MLIFVLTIFDLVACATAQRAGEAVNCTDKLTNCISSKCKIDDHGTTVCSEGCKPGFAAETCLVPCNDTCYECHVQDKDVCTSCRGGLRAATCRQRCPDDCFACTNDGTCVMRTKDDCQPPCQTHTLTIVFGVLLAIAVLTLLVLFIIWQIRKRK